MLFEVLYMSTYVHIKTLNSLNSLTHVHVHVHACSTCMHTVVFYSAIWLLSTLSIKAHCRVKITFQYTASVIAFHVHYYDSPLRSAPFLSSIITTVKQLRHPPVFV